MKKILDNDWQELLENEFNSSYYKNLREKLIDEYNNFIVYPNPYEIFTALKLTSYKDTKVVILGQDPYHNPNQAHGMSFSVKDGVNLPPSLRNIYTELKSDLGIDIAKSGNLENWARQGVLLLNTTLTVRKNEPMSHAGLGWEKFTDRIISLVDEKQNPVVFILWGAHAKSKMKLLKNKTHLIITSAHPSPLSAYRGFFGSKPFSRANEYLKENGLSEIDWRVVK